MTADFLLGFTTFGCMVISLFFLRYWRSTADRFFALMALAFAVFAVNRTVLALFEQTSEARPVLYVVRLAAFGLILIAIIDRQRAPD